MYDAFFTESELDKKKVVKPNPFFDFSNERYNRESFKEKELNEDRKENRVERPVKKEMYYKPKHYSSRPAYRYSVKQPKVNVAKSIGNTIKAINKFNEDRRMQKVRQVKELKMRIKQRLASQRAERELANLKKAEFVLKSAKSREALSKVKQGVHNISASVKSKFKRSIYD